MTRARSWIRLALGIALAAGAAGAGCGGEAPDRPPGPGKPRPFRLALNPFPAAPSVASFIAAVDYAVASADVVLHQHDGGVPWRELLAGQELPASVTGDIAYRAARSRQAGRRIFVAATPLNMARDGLAPQLGTQSLPAELAGATLADPRVRAAFAAWCLALADGYEPDLFAVVIEANMYARSHPEGWLDLVGLYREVAAAVKEGHPDLPVFVTLQLEYLRGDLPAPGHAPQWPLLADLAPDLDRVAFSTYPSVAGRTAGVLTAAYFADAVTAARAYTQAPVLISETGYPSETVTVAGVTFPGSLADQRQYAAILLAAAESLELEMVTWIFPFDFPEMYEAIAARLPPGQAEALRIFVPMGLNEESRAAKPAAAVWLEAARRPVSNP